MHRFPGGGVFAVMVDCFPMHLGHLIHQCKLQRNALDIQSIAVQMLQALDYLHAIGIVHCDIKPDNILVDHHNSVKVN